MNYYNEIENYIKKNEVSKRVRVLEENHSTLENYWNIGRLLVEAQGGDKRAKYGNGLIKEWAQKFSNSYGSNYSYANMARFKQLYLSFPILATVWRLSWSHIKLILPIKDKNKQNYYINLCNTKNLSVRELKCEMESNSYERLVNKPDKIEIIAPITKYSLFDAMKDPITIELEKERRINSEHDLEIEILAKLQNFFNQLGDGFSLIDNQYKLSYNQKNYYIDIFLFNYKFNCFFVVELKLRELRKEDKAQIEFYMQIVDEQIKEPFHNKTIGIIISKQQDKLIANFVRSETIIPLTYKINNKQ